MTVERGVERLRELLAWAQTDGTDEYGIHAVGCAAWVEECAPSLLAVYDAARPFLRETAYVGIGITDELDVRVTVAEWETFAAAVNRLQEEGK